MEFTDFVITITGLTKKVLETPLETALNNPDLDFPFVLIGLIKTGLDVGTA